MRVRALLFVSAALAAVGCEVILGIDGHDAHLAQTGPSATLEAGAEASANEAPCVLPSAGDATLRVGNLIADTARVDVCLRRADGASPIDGKPVIASSGPTCPRGLGFKDVSAPFKLPSGTYDVTFVAAGSACTSTPLGTTHTTIASGAGEGAYVIGGGTKAPLVLALNETSPQQLNSKIRFVHGVDGLGALDFGNVGAASLPTSILNVVVTDVAYGAVSTSSGDPDGYVEVAIYGGTLPFGAAPTGTTSATITTDPALTVRESYTAFTIGRVADPTFPEEIYVCDEMQNEGALTRCANGGATDITVDVFDAYLWGPFSPLDTLRTDPVVAAIADLPSDVACILDTFPEALDARIIAAAKAKFPYSVHFKDTLTTNVDDPAMQDGGIPPAPTTAPCAGALDAKLEALLSCMRDNCVTQLGSEDAGVIDEPTACQTANCYTESAALVLSSDQNQRRCWMCALLNFESDSSIADTRTECTTNVNAGLGYDGASDAILLSKYPIGAAEQWVLGSTDWRANILRAPLTLPGPKSVDAYCAVVTDPVGSETNPYTGYYGLGLTDPGSARGAENELQLQKLVAYVTRKSAGVPAIVAGEFYAGPSTKGTISYEPASYAVLSAAFGFGAPPGAVPGCTFCGNNPITSPPGSVQSASSTLTTYPLLSNIPVTDVTTASIELKAAVIDAGIPDGGSDAGAYVVPLSPYYDYRATIHLRH